MTAKILLGVASLALCACAAPLPVPAFPGPADARIYVVGHGGHTGIVVRKADVPPGLWPELRDFPHAKYLEIGWGDADFYPSPDPGPWTTFKAAFLPTDSVLHVVGINVGVTRYFVANEVVAISLPRAAVASLVVYVHNAYLRSGAGPVAPIGRGLYGDSRFYPARESFHLLRTCNVWAAGALRAAGLPIHDDLTAEGLMAQARALGVVERPASSDATRATQCTAVGFSTSSAMP